MIAFFKKRYYNVFTEVMSLYKKKKNKHTRRMIVITVVLIVTSVYALVSGITELPFSSVFQDTIANAEYYVIKSPVNYVKNVFTEYHDLKLVYRENKKLKRSLDNYASELAMNEVLSNELSEMKKITNIESLPTDYKVKYTTIIERDAESWSNQVKINMGSNSQIQKGMAVITSKGMIGTVTKVGTISSTVTLLCSENNSVQLPVMIVDGENTYYGLVNSYNVKAGTYKVSLLSTVDKIQKGLNVTTSGLGGKGKSPKGILVGKVVGFNEGTDASGKYVTVKPSVNFDSLNYVAVVQRVN